MNVLSLFYPMAPFDWFSRFGLNYIPVWCFAFFWTFALGSCLGSFLNVCIWRMPRGESLSKRASHCVTCGAPIRWFDNIPVVSYLVLRGRCRHCHEPYSPRYLVVELLCGTLFTAILLKTGTFQQPFELLALYWLAALYCVCAAWIDAEHRIIPDRLSGFVAVAALVIALLLPGAWGTDSRLGALAMAVISAGLPGCFLALFAWIGRWIARRDVFGLGDVKFVAVSGLLIGLPGVIFALFAASLGGMIYGIALAAVRRRALRRTAIPFGPFLAGGVLLWIFCGQWFIRFLID